VISDNIVSQFGGKIGVKSKYKRGSIFMFSVLLGRDEDYKDLQNHDAVLKPSSGGSGGVQISSGGTVTGSAGSMYRINSIAASSMSVKLKSSERK